MPTSAFWALIRWLKKASAKKRWSPSSYRTSRLQEKASNGSEPSLKNTEPANQTGFFFRTKMRSGTLKRAPVTTGSHNASLTTAMPSWPTSLPSRKSSSMIRTTSCFLLPFRNSFQKIISIRMKRASTSATSSERTRFLTKFTARRAFGTASEFFLRAKNKIR